MTTREPLTPTETYWDQQRKTLSRIREQALSPQGKPHGGRAKNTNNNSRTGYSPLDDTHPLLQRSRASPPVPAQLPRLSTPPEHRKYHSPDPLRGAQYKRIPPVTQPRYDDRPERFGSPAYDSWGEEEDSDDDYRVPVTYPPVMMYPMVYAGQPPTGARKKQHKNDKKKRVRYRNTPTYLNSRDNTLHSPLPPPLSAEPDYPTTTDYPTDTTSQFSYIHPQSDSRYNPFDPSKNPVVAKYLPGLEPTVQQRPPPHTVWKHEPPSPRQNVPLRTCEEHFNSNWLFATGLVEEFISEVIREDFGRAVAEDTLAATPRNTQRRPVIHRPLEYSSDTGYVLRNDPLEEFLNEMLEDVVIEESVLSVKEAVHQLVDEHLAQAAVVDIMGDMINEILEQETPKLAQEAISECLLEDILDDLVIGPATENDVKEVAMDTMDKYSDKKRRREIKEVRALTGDKLVDTFCLDYLIALTARQGKLFTQGEHADKLFDSMLLNILLHQYTDVTNTRKQTIDNKAIRRMHEKMTTDVALKVVMEELSQCLDQDMLDLDEYEHGYRDNLDDLHRRFFSRRCRSWESFFPPQAAHALLYSGNSSDLEKWLAGT